MYLIPTPLVSIIPLRKKDEKQLEELGYKFSHNETNHIVYKHTVIKHPQKGATILRPSQGDREIIYGRYGVRTKKNLGVGSPFFFRQKIN